MLLLLKNIPIQTNKLVEAFPKLYHRGDTLFVYGCYTSQVMQSVTALSVSQP